MSAGATTRIRVLVVDDSAFMRKVLQGIITSDPQMEVVGHAQNGEEAVALADSLKPDVITMDINMPRMDGLEATELIMAKNPRPIVIVSSESRQGAESTLRALELGAIEFVAKPSSNIDLDMQAVGSDLIRKLKMAAKVRVVRNASVRRPRVGAQATIAGPRQSSAPLPRADLRFPVIVLAASTGGPAAVMRLVPGFARGFPAAVLLVQHMPASFTSQFAQQLSELTTLRVKDAEHDESLQPGTLYVCPGSHHLRISSSGQITLDNSGRIAGYLPCIDVTMKSVAAYAGAMSVGVVLTGMGNDGAKGVQSIKTVGGLVIAQDEASSVIFGMPAEAIKTGTVDQVLALDDISAALEKHVLILSRVTPVGAR